MKAERQQFKEKKNGMKCQALRHYKRNEECFWWAHSRLKMAEESELEYVFTEPLKTEGQGEKC